MPAVGLGRGAAHVVAGGGAPAFHPTDVPNCIEFWDATVPGDRVMSGLNLTSWTGRKGLHVLAPAGTGNIIELPAEVNGQSLIQTNGTTNWLENSTLTLPAPGTTPTWMVAFWRVDVISSFDQVFGAKQVGSYRIAIVGTGTGAALDQRNATGVNSTAGPGIGQFERLAALFTNSTSDYVKRRAVTTTGGNAGGSAPGLGLALGSRAGDATTYCQVSVGAVGLYSSEPSAPNRALIDGWVTTKFGAGWV